MMVTSSAAPGDTRGIIDPAAMLRLVAFDRAEPGEELAGLVDWFWSVAWDLPEGATHHQQVLNQPCGNLSVGTLDDDGVLDPAQGRLYGVHTGVSDRHLSGAGWTVAAKTTAGGLGLLLDGPASAATGRQLSLAQAVPGLDAQTLVDAVIASEPTARVTVLRDALREVVSRRDPRRVAMAREVAGIARQAEVDRSIRRRSQLATRAGVSQRTLDRMFAEHVGVSPAWLIRRWRIIDALEQAAREGGPQAGWAALAVDLGYADQAHLARDVHRHLGVTPTAYLGRQAQNR